jgi:hypothetical protein
MKGKVDWVEKITTITMKSKNETNDDVRMV